MAGTNPNRTQASEDLTADFDRLPVVVRKALRSTIRNWGAKDAQLCLDQGYDPHELAQVIRDMDRNTALAEGGYKQCPARLG